MNECLTLNWIILTLLLPLSLLIALINILSNRAWPGRHFEPGSKSKHLDVLLPDPNQVPFVLWKLIPDLLGKRLPVVENQF